MSTFQDAKDSFYLALRDRLAVLNPDRVMNVRGTTRPAVLVAENEMEFSDGNESRETFVLLWDAAVVDVSEAMPLEHARCQIQFRTAGSPELAGMDRGRVLSAMRTELEGMLRPRQVAKKSYAGAVVTTAATPVFWSGVASEATTQSSGELVCTCAVEVFAWKELQ